MGGAKIRALGVDPDNPVQVKVEGHCPTDPAHTCLVSLLSGAWVCGVCESSGELRGGQSLAGVTSVGNPPDPPERFGRTAAELLAEQPEEVDWLVPGLLAPGWSMKLAAREKTGKGTLIAYLIGCLERDEATVFGEAPGRRVTSLILTEEPPESMREKLAAFGLQRSVVVSGHELARYGYGWGEKVELLVDRAVEDGHGIVFVDNISRAAGIEDENGTEMARACELLIDRAREHGIACILDHHHKKGGSALEDKSRGGTALAGAVDINVEMVRSTNDWTSRSRTLSARGRLRATIWELTVELTGDSTRYVRAGADPRAGSGELDTKERMRRDLVAALQDREGEWFKTGDARDLVSGNTDTKGQVLKELANSSAWPVRSRRSSTGGVEYTYDADAQAGFVGEVLGERS